MLNLSRDPDKNISYRTGLFALAAGSGTELASCTSIGEQVCFSPKRHSGYDTTNQSQSLQHRAFCSNYLRKNKDGEDLQDGRLAFRSKPFQAVLREFDKQDTSVIRAPGSSLHQA